MKKQHGVYKYVTCDKGEIIYIGKTNSNFKSRIDGHAREERFQKYEGNYKVYVSYLPNTVETDIIERALINEYKPVLNVVDNHKGFSNLITVNNLEWEEYIIEPRHENIINHSLPTTHREIKEPKYLKNYMLLGENMRTGLYAERDKFSDKRQAIAYLANIVYMCRFCGTDKNNRYEIQGENISAELKDKILHDYWNLPNSIVIKWGYPFNKYDCYSISPQAWGLGDEVLFITFDKDIINVMEVLVDMCKSML